MANIEIGGRLHSTATGNVVAGANEILDDTKGKKQNVINSETDTHLGNLDAEIIRVEGKTDENREEINRKQFEAGAVEIDPYPIENSENLVRSGAIYDAYTHQVYIRPDSAQGAIPDFDAASQSVHITPQVLSDAQKIQARANLGFGDGQIDDVPTAGSDNLVKSSGVDSILTPIKVDIDAKITGNSTIIEAGRHEILVSGLRLKKNVVYHLIATLSSALANTLYIVIYDKYGNSLFTTNIATSTLIKDTYYFPDQDYDDVYIEMYANGASNVGKSVSLLFEEGGKNILGILNRISQIFGENAQLLRIPGNDNSSKNTQFATTIGHKYRIYIANKSEWTVSNVAANSTILSVDIYNTTTSDWNAICSYKVEDFAKIPNYIDLTAEYTQARVLIRADSGNYLYFEIMDITKNSLLAKVEDMNVLLTTLSNNELLTHTFDVMINTGSYTFTPDIKYATYYFSEYLHLKAGKLYKLSMSTVSATTNYITSVIVYGENNSALFTNRAEAGTTSSAKLFRVGHDGLYRLAIYTAMSNNDIALCEPTFTLEEQDNDVMLRSNIANSPAKYGRYYSHLFSDNGSNQDDIIIPFESVYDVEIAARLGFKVIEGNVLQTEDGEYLVMHGSSGKFGGMYQHIDGVTDISETLVSSVTEEWVKTNVRFKSKYPKYRTAISTLKEWLITVKRYNMIPLVQIVDDAEIVVIESIFTKDNYIAYGATRQQTSAPITVWRGETSANAIINYVGNPNRGIPFFYGLNNTVRNSMSESELKQMCDEVHKENIWMLTSYLSNEANNQKALSCGFDFMAATWQIPQFSQGNLCDICSGSDFVGFSHNGTVQNASLLLNNGTISPSETIPSVFLGACLLSIRFSGTISLTMGKIVNNSLTSDGSKPLLITSYSIEQIPTFEIVTNGEVTVYEITFKSSSR